MADSKMLGSFDFNELNLDFLEPILESYVANLADIRKEEVYKWEAVKCFQDNWDPEASNFSEMLEAAMAKASNLLTGYNYFPLPMLKVVAKENPSFAKEALLELFDGEYELRQRIELFANTMDAEVSRINVKDIEQGKSIHSYQDPRAISVYLTFAKPARFFLYKTSVFSTFVKALGTKVSNNKYDKLISYYWLLDNLLAWIKEKHPEVIVASDATLSEELKSVDPEHHLLMQDILYYSDSYLKRNGGDDNDGVVSVEDNKKTSTSPADLSDSGEPNYWWITANPHYWSWDSIGVGEGVEYTAYNENHNKRRVFQYFQQAKVGDLIVGYHTTPEKCVKCFGKVVKPLSEEPTDCVGIIKTAEAENSVTYAMLLNDPVLSKMEYISTNPTGTIFKLTKEQYEHIYELAMEPASDIEPYTDKDFLNEVYLEKDELVKLKALLERKKNLILQGAPGTGKTYAAKRLAYDIMGCKDDNRIQMVQFHQNTTYDDLVCGYRPTPDGSFSIKNGVFVDFCRKAQKHLEDKYFFIIDEINRANISKVFGELLMLIEADHRGEEILLPVSGEAFSVPRNVYIIGMMNTADRGLALIDYALRRRFAFYEMEPALDNAQFLNGLGKNGAMKKLVDAVKQLNEDIAADSALGKGFRIGHSYFCSDDDGDELTAQSVVEFELVPLIEEYWFDDQDKMNKEIVLLESAVK